MSRHTATGLGRRLKGYTKELVAEVTGDADLQEAGRRDIAEGRAEDRRSSGDRSSEAGEGARRSSGS